jgi:DNA-binding PadR family transcriptional regulator
VAKRRKVSNVLALALLAVLAPGRPMHPYQMVSVLRRTGKEHDMKIKWGSLYTVVQNLEKHGFIEATGSNREGRRPERTIYALTEAGRAELKDWLRELVAEPEKEYPRFEAALSVLGVLPPDEVTELLEERLRALDAGIAGQRAGLEQAGQEVPRVFLIEGEYALAMREAEATWVRALLKELTDGTLSGVAEWREYHKTGGAPPGWTELLEEAGVPHD